MTRRSRTDFADPEAHALLERLATVGPDAPDVDEQLAIVAALRAGAPDTAAAIDRWLIEETSRLRGGLLEAQGHQAELKEILTKLSFTPWHPAVFLGPVIAGSGPAAAVAFGGGVRIVGLADGVVLDDLAIGDEVLLGRDLNVVMRKASSPLLRSGDTAELQRVLTDGRLVLKRHDDEVVVRAADALDVRDLVRGDRVRWDPSVWLALEKIERTSDTSLFLEDTPAEGFEAIGGLDREIERLQQSIRLHLFNGDIVRRYQLRRAASVLLVGPPGTGKTMVARALAHWLAQVSPGGRARFAHIKPGALHSMWYSQSEANYRRAFKAAREAGEHQPDVPVVLFFDEVDSVGAVRGNMTTRIDDKVQTSFMAELDGLEARGNILVVAATNRREALDPALLRPGRLGDLILDIPRPGMSAAAAIFAKHLPADIPYGDGSGGETQSARRSSLINAAVSRLYAPNGEGDVATVMFRDGTRRAIQARDVASGASIAKMARVAIEQACLREAARGESGVRTSDLLDAIADELECAVGALTPANCHMFISELPQDLAVVRVEPVVRRVRRPHRYRSAA
jgi:proteasome-associated ATPase